MFPEIQGNCDKHSFFRLLPAYVLVFEDRDGDPCAVSSTTEQDRAITCFLSPFDAVIEAGLRTALGQRCQLFHASLLDGNLFRDADGAGFIADIHLGWPARDGCLLQAARGAVGRYAREMHHWAGEPEGFEVDAVTFAEFSKLHERAGLFAWQETNAEVLHWTDARLRGAEKRAVETIAFAQGGIADCNQIALFDPEFGQWHFVPIPSQLDIGGQPNNQSSLDSGIDDETAS
ncbi:hypothetical protein BJN34_13530 [Cupriavidus necator]|uniref:Uncharacterized protein n=1 Tax=Cupriavidus necator TaxID=106590 RepID=A0A1U9UQF3_CUPNE|nr:hypothetical protein [Cupriavidus necator]AQV94902.1 hypothetical protein BJN34_13530 [Cupriavidus necator]